MKNFLNELKELDNINIVYDEILSQKEKLSNLQRKYIFEIKNFFINNNQLFRIIALSNFFRYCKNQNLNKINIKNTKHFDNIIMENHFYWNIQSNEIRRFGENISEESIIKEMNISLIKKNLLGRLIHIKEGIEFQIDKKNISKIIFLSISGNIDFIYEELIYFYNVDFSKEEYNNYKKNEFFNFFSEVATARQKKFNHDLNSIYKSIKNDYNHISISDDDLENIIKTSLVITMLGEK